MIKIVVSFLIVLHCNLFASIASQSFILETAVEHQRRTQVLDSDNFAERSTAHPLGEPRSSVKLDGSMTCGYVPCTTAVSRFIHEKMLKNERKAIQEHREKSKDLAYATLEEALQPFEDKVSTSLQFSLSDAEAIGPRPTMQDAHFYKMMSQGLLVGVFDGHGETGAIAKFASEIFQKRFPQLLSQKNILECFKKVIQEIHEKVLLNKDWDDSGTTACVCFIEKATNKIYTATLGDTEAKIYRKINGKIKSIPLSLVRDWSSKKEARRASLAMECPEIAQEWPKRENAKELRLFHRINVARAIGDKNCCGTPDKPGIVQKPKITVNVLKSGDELILACDGVWDYVLEHEIVEQIEQHPTHMTLAKRLVDYALKEKSSYDNVTVLAIRAE